MKTHKTFNNLNSDIAVFFSFLRDSSLLFFFPSEIGEKKTIFQSHLHSEFLSVSWVFIIFLSCRVIVINNRVSDSARSFAAGMTVGTLREGRSYLCHDWRSNPFVVRRKCDVTDASSSDRGSWVFVSIRRKNGVILFLFLSSLFS